MNSSPFVTLVNHPSTVKLFGEDAKLPKPRLLEAYREGWGHSKVYEIIKI